MYLEIVQGIYHGLISRPSFYLCCNKYNCSRVPHAWTVNFEHEFLDAWHTVNLEFDVYLEVQTLYI